MKLKVLISEGEDVTGSLMKLSELSLHDFLATEPEISTRTMI